MLFRLFLLFTITPCIELILLIEIGKRIGASNTILIILGTGIAGAYLAKSQGVRILREISDDLSQGIIPTDSILQGLIVLGAGLLLITPGFMTDVLGLLLLTPVVRRFIVAYLRDYFRRKIDSGEMGIFIHFR